MAQFSVHDAKTNLSRLIADALAGGEVVIARGNVPAVRLVPVNPRGRRQFGALKGKIAIDARFDEPLPADELDGWALD
ncbi:type II toxin-antitoxin system prevent-host-death family antitoxin [Sandarakinorhabdus sp.]|jgi:prevent-host-death family protein|uniref:type II toxin-antitoxin system Phd/YefM family antitoxin n=1 Tax=Sandarakinorhabdus sp. TaxID=1916663 RepID=UPI003341E5C5